jgi:hypothetical protein
MLELEAAEPTVYCLKGAQTRSCSSPVFVEQTAEQIASTNLARLILADTRQQVGLVPQARVPDADDAGCSARQVIEFLPERPLEPSVCP